MQNALYRSALIAAAALVLSSAAPQPPSDDAVADQIETQTESPSSPKFAGAFATFLKKLHETSCPSGIEIDEPRSTPVTVKPIPLQSINPGRKAVGALTYVGGFELSSPDAGFGGWSGLDLLGDGRLLAVSDAAHYLWIDLAADGFRPIAFQIGELRDNGGNIFPTKVAGDAEDIAIFDDLVFAAFEGDPRVDAYDIERCSHSARSAPLGWDLIGGFARAGLYVNPNLGLEGLTITDDGYVIAGLETQANGESLLSIGPLETTPRFNLRIGKGSPELVSLAQVPDGDSIRLFSLHRSSQAPMSSNAITFIETVIARDPNPSASRADQTFTVKSSRVLAEMNLLLTIDNYEGIAAHKLPDGRIRLYVISDNNFSSRQRTLLMAFDVVK